MHALLRNTYGVDATPYLRPPYGHHNARSLRWPPTWATR